MSAINYYSKLKDFIKFDYTIHIHIFIFDDQINLVTDNLIYERYFLNFAQSLNWLWNNKHFILFFLILFSYQISRFTRLLNISSNIL